MELADKGYGQSIYDEDINFVSQADDLNEVRAIEQPWYAQLGAGLAKGAVLTGTTFLDGTVGLVLGAGTAINEGDGLVCGIMIFPRLCNQSMNGLKRHYLITIQEMSRRSLGMRTSLLQTS